MHVTSLGLGNHNKHGLICYWVLFEFYLRLRLKASAKLCWGSVGTKTHIRSPVIPKPKLWHKCYLLRGGDSSQTAGDPQGSRSLTLDLVNPEFTLGKMALCHQKMKRAIFGLFHTVGLVASIWRIMPTKICINRQILKLYNMYGLRSKYLKKYLASPMDF